jgi:hypothetical protein
LISRVPQHYKLQELIKNFNAVGQILNRAVDLVDFKARFDNGEAVFQRTGKKISYLVKLKKLSMFHTLGTRNGTHLPLFFFTQRGVSEYETSVRLAVQAVSMDYATFANDLQEVAAIRGFPDCCHTSSALLPIIIAALQERIHEAFLPVLCTVPIVRKHSEKETLRVEELFLRVFMGKGARRNDIRTSLGILPEKTTVWNLGSWIGQLATSVEVFEHSPTNVPELMNNPSALMVEGLSGDPDKDLATLGPYFRESTEYAAIGYLRGDIDSPTLSCPLDVLLLLPTSACGGYVSFDRNRWLEDNEGWNGCKILLPGISSLRRNYEVNPFPKPVSRRGATQTPNPSDPWRLGGAYVHGLTILEEDFVEVIPTSSVPVKSTSNDHRPLNTRLDRDFGDRTSSKKKKPNRKLKTEPISREVVTIPSDIQRAPLKSDSRSKTADPTSTALVSRPQTASLTSSKALVVAQPMQSSLSPLALEVSKVKLVDVVKNIIESDLIANRLAMERLEAQAALDRATAEANRKLDRDQAEATRKHDSEQAVIARNEDRAHTEKLFEKLMASFGNRNGDSQSGGGSL